MQFRDYVDSLTDKQLEKYAKSIPAAVSTIKIKYYHAYQIPRKDKFNALWKNSDGNISEQELVDHFYSEEAAA